MNDKSDDNTPIIQRMLKAASEPAGNVFQFPGRTPVPNSGEPLPTPGEYLDGIAPTMAAGFSNWPLDALKAWHADWRRHVAIANMVVAHIEAELETRKSVS
ncbi:hypothetical protein [Mesorhizobium sp. CN2-181]|uniref:hypothetical protein n=1 Tax=Mesorhizobium yinganensis TaxID=3157707 RepID=UPI0032B82D8E